MRSMRSSSRSAQVRAVWTSNFRKLSVEFLKKTSSKNLLTSLVLRKFWISLFQAGVAASLVRKCLT